MKKIAIFLLLALTAVLPFASFAQGTAKIGIDESNVIFAGCRLSNLQAAYPGAPTPTGTAEPTEEDPSGKDIEDYEEGDEGDQEEIANDKEVIEANNNLDASDIKNKYIKGCVQEIIRFVIIMASLAAILNIAVAGILQLTDPNAKPIRTKLTNTIIGLFLLIVGWNLIPIFNNSFNNVNFLSLPAVNVCTQANYCTTEDQIQQRKHYLCMKRYQAIKEDKQFSDNIKLQEEREDCLVAFCKVKNNYPRIRFSNCIDYTKKGSIVAKIQALIKEGNAERAKRTISGAAPGAPAADPSCKEPEKAPKPLVVGLTHYKYAEAAASDLVTVDGFKLHKDAAKGYTEMKTAAAKEGVSLKIISAFRSVADQTKIVNDKRKNGLSDTVIYKSSSEPGYSEHHTGKAMDLNSLVETFGTTKEGKWIETNASKYGFEVSFPRGNKQNLVYEPWHIRYVKDDPKTFCFASKK